VTGGVPVKNVAQGQEERTMVSKMLEHESKFNGKRSCVMRNSTTWLQALMGGEYSFWTVAEVAALDRECAEALRVAGLTVEVPS
jgi:hypothetical protein